MLDVQYVLSENVHIDDFEEGAIITIESSDNVVCLRSFERELLKLLIGRNFKEVIELLKNKYIGDTIEADVREYCDKLCSINVLNKIEL